MSIHQLTITNRFPNDSAHKFKIVKMIHIYHAQRVGLESGTISGSREESIVGVEYLSGQYQIPFSCESTCIYACVCLNVCKCVSVCVWVGRGMCVCACVFICACMRMCVFICVFICACVLVCMHIHIYFTYVCE